MKEDLPGELYDEFQRSFENFHRRTYFRDVEYEIKNSKIAARQFIDAGSVIGVGTDGGSPMNFHTEAMWREMAALVDSGMTPSAVIAAATKTNAEILGKMQLIGGQRKLGTIEPGKKADIIVIDGDPRFSMGYLNKPDLVIKDGIPWYTQENESELLKEIGHRF